MKINTNLAPPDGYWFKENDGSVIRAPSSWRGVIIRIARYRRRNKFPAGNPEAELAAQVCARSPGLCAEGANPVHAAALKKATLKTRILAWLGHMRGRTDLRWVPQDVAEARAAVCRGCPKHASIGGGCGSCKKAVRAARREVLGGRDIDESLAGCLVLGEDCAVNTKTDEPTVENQELPGCCWRRRS